MLVIALDLESVYNRMGVKMIINGESKDQSSTGQMDRHIAYGPIPHDMMTMKSLESSFTMYSFKLACTV